MTNEEKEFAVKVNVDKAKNKIIPAFFLIIISILTYVFPLIMGMFDFGFVFEIASFICLLIARFFMGNYDEANSKRFVIFAMIPVGWMMIYDAILILSSIEDVSDIMNVGYVFLWEELLSILYMGLLIGMNRNLAKADNPEKYKESTDWFYETYEGDKDKKENKN